MKQILIVSILMFLGCTSKIRDASEECKAAIAFINKHWYKHREKKLYKYKEVSKEEFVNRLNTKYKNCFFSLSADEIKSLFGEPNEEIPTESLAYNMSEGCSDSTSPCELLMIGFDPNTLKPLYIMNQ